MRRYRTYIGILLLVLAAASCKSEKRLSYYNDLYREQPATIYIAPLADMSMRRVVRTTEDSLFNQSLNTAAQQLYLTAADPLVYRGYYVPGPLASAQIAATEHRSGKQLRNEDISDYHSLLGIDAVLFITLKEWRQTANSWSVEVEYALRSTETGHEMLHVDAHATKTLPFDFKASPLPLPEDRAFSDRYGCDLETAQRCRLVEILNRYVLKDLPSGRRARATATEQYEPAHPEYFTLKINADGTVQISKTDQ
ncbi:MAG: hypothetical protein J6I49_01670 [Bacteroidales bacterium]|nr:hypothetical protein [Bacteroidales bacterium]